MMYWHASEAASHGGGIHRDVNASGPDADCDRNGVHSEVTADEIERVRRARQLRAKFFDSNLFADPAWDILLDLYRAHLAQQRICTTTACFGSGVPVSTALRWLNALEQRGLARRSPDPLDGRRYFVALTEDGLAAMSGYFWAVQAL